MFRTRLKSTASCLKSGDSVNSGSTSSLRRRTGSGLMRPPVPVRHRADVAHVGAALLEHVAHAVDQERRRAARVASVGVARGSSRRAAPIEHRPSVTATSRPVSSGRSTRMRTSALRRAAQAVRIARPGRPLAGGEHADDGVELVGQRHRRPGDRRLAELLARRRRVGFDADRQVVEVDRLPHLLGQPVLARVDAAHRALQLGELAHHVGGEVGLAQPAGRRAHGSAAPGASNTSAAIQRASWLDALRLLAVAAELLVEQHRASRSMLRSSGCLRSASQKNRASRSRAVSTRSEIARDHLGCSGSMLSTARNTGMQLALRRRPPGRSADDESSSSSALLRAAAGTPRRTSRRRPTDTRPGPAPRRAAPAPTSATRDAAAAAARLGIELARDAIVPLAALEDDEVLGQPLAVVVEALDLDRAAGAAAGRQEAMAVGDRARADVLHQRALRAAAVRQIVNGTTRPP